MLNIRIPVLAAATFLGIGYILNSVSVTIILIYYLLKFNLVSPEISLIGGTILFILASILFMIMSVFLIIGGLYFYRWGAPEGIIFLGVLLASFYLLCLGIGSALFQMSLCAILLIISPVLFMVGTAVYVSPSFDFKLIGSILGIVGAALLAVVIFSLQIFTPVFVGWNVPFTGPFMSMPILEGTALLSGSVAVLVHLILMRREEEITSYIFFSTVTLIYGIGTVVGPLILTLNLWDLLWKAPWLGPLRDVPYWVFGTTIFWSVSLIVLMVGGALLVVSSCLRFASVAKEFSQV